MSSEKFVKLNISIPPDLHRWIKKKQEDFKKKNPVGRLDISPLIADCIRAMKESEEGKAVPGAGAVIHPASEISVSGPSTRGKNNSRKAS